MTQIPGARSQRDVVDAQRGLVRGHRTATASSSNYIDGGGRGNDEQERKVETEFSQMALRSHERYLCRPPRRLPSIPPLPRQGNNGDMFEEQIYAPHSSSSRVELSECIRPWTRRDDGACRSGGICGCGAGGV
jgi:hypothetical protein